MNCQRRAIRFNDPAAIDRQPAEHLGLNNLVDVQELRSVRYGFRSIGLADSDRPPALQVVTLVRIGFPEAASTAESLTASSCIFCLPLGSSAVKIASLLGLPQAIARQTVTCSACYSLPPESKPLWAAARSEAKGREAKRSVAAQRPRSGPSSP